MSCEKKIWVLICGSIRLSLEFYTVIARLNDFRSKGLIEGIIWSTWQGEPDTVSDLRTRLQYLDIRIVETIWPDEKILKSLVGSYYNQCLQINAGLRVIPDNVFVLKCRTDKCLSTINKLSTLLTDNIDLSVDDFGYFPKVFQHKIVTSGIWPSSFFGGRDGVFFGWKNDLKKLILMERFDWTLARNVQADCMFYAAPFINVFPLIREMNELFSIQSLNLIDYITSYVDTEFVLPELFIKAFALYFLVVYTHFLQINDLPEPEIELSLTDAFTGKSNGLFQRNIFTSSSVPSKIVNGKLADSNCYRALYRQIIKLGEKNYAVNLSITQSDIKQLDEANFAFFKNQLRSRIKFTRQDTLVSNDDVIDALFSDYFETQKERIMLSSTINRLGRSKNYGELCFLIYNKHSITNDKFKHALLGGALREVRYPAVYEAIKRVYQGISDNAIRDEVFFFFNHYENDIFRDTRDYKKLLSWWYYLAVIQDENPTLAKKLFIRYAKTLEEPFSDNSGDYAKRIIEITIKEVNALPHDYNVNETIWAKCGLLTELSEYQAIRHEILDFIMDSHDSLPRQQQRRLSELKRIITKKFPNTIEV